MRRICKYFALPIIFLLLALTLTWAQNGLNFGHKVDPETGHKTQHLTDETDVFPRTSSGLGGYPRGRSSSPCALFAGGYPRGAANTTAKKVPRRACYGGYPRGTGKNSQREVPKATGCGGYPQGQTDSPVGQTAPTRALGGYPRGDSKTTAGELPKFRGYPGGGYGGYPRGNSLPRIIKKTDSTDANTPHRETP